MKKVLALVMALGLVSVFGADVAKPAAAKSAAKPAVTKAAPAAKAEAAAKPEAAKK
ncbi:MAG: hypothetical protein PHW64_04750 [Sulfuricurvum sp.]|nr:hypothetical protein [Sulfuricurvum sp.]